MLGTKRMVGTLGFVLSVAASSQAPQPLFHTGDGPAVRTFRFESDEGARPILLSLHRSFALPDLKDDWEAPDEADDLFANEMTLGAARAGVKVAPLSPEDPEEPAPAAAPTLERFRLEAHTTLPGDTLRAVATRTGCDAELLARWNRVEDPDALLPPGTALEAYRGSVRVHEVQAGDTLWSISRLFRVPLRELLWLNRLDTLVLHPGQRLWVARGVIDAEVERRAATDLKTSVLLSRAKQRMQEGDGASASHTVGVQVARPVSGRITSGFGWRRHPILKRRSFHRGVDIRAPEGTLIRSLDAGKVVFAGDSGPGGKSVIVRHPNHLYSIYAHCAQIHVTKGDEIPAGTGIARVGKTGRATAPHLHFAMKRGATSIDPLPFLRP